MALPLFLLTLSLGWVSSSLPLYLWSQGRHGVPVSLGVEPQELRAIDRALIGYFRSDQEPLRIELRDQDLFNAREVVHLRDVKGLLRLNSLLRGLSLAYLLAFTLGGLGLRRRAFWGPFRGLLRLGAAITLGLILALGLGIALGFDRLFLAFHLLSFSNPFWQLDPRQDRLIVLFPQGFFYNMSLLVATATASQALVLGALAHWWRKT